MNTNKNQPEQTEEHPEIKVEDLPLDNNTDEAVKGGPAYIKYGGIEGSIAPRRP